MMLTVAPRNSEEQMQTGSIMVFPMFLVNAKSPGLLMCHVCYTADWGTIGSWPPAFQLLDCIRDSSWVSLVSSCVSLSSLPMETLSAWVSFIDSSELTRYMQTYWSWIGV